MEGLIFQSSEFGTDEIYANMEEYIMQITRDNYSQYAQMVQQMFGKKASSNDPLAQCDYHLMTIPTDRRKLLLGKIIYIGYMILFSNVIVFAGATLGGFLLTTHVPVKGALIAVLFLTVSELWEIPVALFLSERFGMIVNLFVCLFITVSGVVISQTRIWYVLVSAIPMRMMCPLLHVLPNGLAAEAGNPLLDTGVIVPGMCLSIIWFVFVTVLFLKWFERREVK